jgi:hypothetical protein
MPALAWPMKCDCGSVLEIAVTIAPAFRRGLISVFAVAWLFLMGAECALINI